MDKPTKPSNLIPRSFGGVKNNFSSSLQSSGYEDGVPAIYGGDNLNYQLDATGKELDYCEKICDYINAIPINKTPIVDANNKLVYTQYDIRVYSASETYYVGDYVTGIVDGVKHIYQSLQNNNIGQSLSNNTYWKAVDIISDIKTIGRNIGEIVTSTIPLADAGLHPLNGAKLEYGIYKDFIDYIASIYSVNANYFCSENDWQTSVTNYGVCGKFVYDSTNNTVRLPKVTGFIEGVSFDNNGNPIGIGNLTEAGLPNITGNFTQGNTAGQIFTGLSSSGAFSMTSAIGTGAFASSNSAQRMKTFDFDASNSNSIYGNSTTVQPQSVKVLYYIVVATTTKTDIEVDIDEIATDLNGKADTDLLNVPESRGILVEKSSKDILPRWYRVYSDGWCEQGGVNTVSSTSVVASLLKNYINNNYSVMTQGYRDTYNANNTTNIQILSKSNSQINMACSTTTLSIEWQACGYIR